MIYRTLFGTPRQRFATPFDELEKMRNQVDRLFDNYHGRSSVHSGAGVFPSINITEDANAFYLSAELPGVKAADLDLNVTANQLTLAGERKIAEEASDVRYHRREREAGRFSRAVALPGDVDADTVRAKLADGVLTVTVPKAEKAKPRQIAVE